MLFSYLFSYFYLWFAVCHYFSSFQLIMRAYVHFYACARVFLLYLCSQVFLFIALNLVAYARP